MIKVNSSYIKINKELFIAISDKLSYIKYENNKNFNKYLLKNNKELNKYYIANLKFSYASLKLDKLLYIIYKISLLQLNKKFKNLNKVPLYSKVLRYEIGPDYRLYLNFLLEFGFISTDNRYIVGYGNNKVAKSKCYGINFVSNSDELYTHTLTQNCLIKKIIKWKDEYMNRIKGDVLLNEIYSMMDNITIDIDGATEYLDKLYYNKEITKRARDLEITKCQRINEHDPMDSLFLTKDSYGRIHTNFTNISKAIRENFLYINGEKAIGVDIKSSQPALLHGVFQDYLETLKGSQSFKTNDPFIIEELNGKAIDIRDKYIGKNNFYTGDHIFDGYIEYKLDTFGFDSYKELVENAERELGMYRIWLESDIYTEFLSRMETKETRKSVKRLFVTHIFSHGKGPHLDSIRNVWYRFFPTLLKIMDSFKEEDYKNMAYRLQKDESTLVYGDLFSTLKLSGINTFTTVHDSVIVPQSQVGLTTSLFNVVLQRNNIHTIAI